MSGILKQFGKNDDRKYLFGEIISASKTTINIKTTAGLSVNITNEAGKYKAGDEVVLSMQGNNLSSIFIVKKLKNLFPDKIDNLII